MLAGAGTGAAAGATTGPAAPVVSPILAALGLTAAAGYGLYQGWDEIKPWVQPIVDYGTESVKRAYNILGSYFYPEEAPAPSSEGTSTGTSGSSGESPSESEPTSSQPAENSTTTATGSGTASPAPANPNPDNNSQRSRLRNALDALRGRTNNNTGGTSPEPKPSRGIAPFTGYNNGSLYGNLLRGIRDWQTIGTGIDLIDNMAGEIGERLDTARVSNANWNLTRDYTPAGFLFHYSTKPAPSKPTAPAESTRVVQSVNSSDTVPGGVAPNSTDYQKADADLEAIRRMYEGN